ncbi:MAG: hypothetical protein VX527_06105 [Planctomycetota bacterium]|nr:hypothetical protein [Planctomycetota bacterium]
MYTPFFITIGLIISGLTVGFQNPGPEESNLQVVLPPADLEGRIIQDAAMLGLAEYNCHWTRFHADMMMKFTDIAIEFSQTAESLEAGLPGEDMGELLRDFTKSKWDDLGAEVGLLTVANGLDSKINWILFTRSAGLQIVQRIIAGDNNWPEMGKMIADQAVDLAKSGHDQVWERFGKRVGHAVERGTLDEWSQWGLQVGMQARIHARSMKVDWNAFAADIAAQATWFESTLLPKDLKKD